MLIRVPMLWLENIAPVFPKFYSDLEKDYKKDFLSFWGSWGNNRREGQTEKNFHKLKVYSDYELLKIIGGLSVTRAQ